MSDWAEQTDPGTGKVYYYQASTGTTSWEKVSARGGCVAEPDACLSGRARRTTSSSAHGPPPPAPPTANPLPFPPLCCGRTPAKLLTSASHPPRTPNPPHPPPPPTPHHPPPPLPPTPQPLTTPQPAGFGAAAAPAADANGGWTAAVDPGSGKTYYHNAATGATSWEVPAGYGGGGASVSLARIPLCAGDVVQLPPLPPRETR